MGCCTLQLLWKIIAIFSMIIACCLIATSIAGLLAYHCIYDASKFQMNLIYLTYVEYFHNDDCRDGNSDYYVGNLQWSERTWIWNIVYLVLSCVWFLSSILLLGAPKYRKTSKGLWLTYPWLFTTLVVICADVAATVTYALDLDHVVTFEDVKNYIQLVLNDQNMAEFEYAPIPQIIMMIIFSKAAIGWILVFISFFTINLLMVKMDKSEDLILQTKAPIDYYMPSVNRGFESEMTELDDSERPAPYHQNQLFSEEIWDSSQKAQIHMIPRARYAVEESDDYQATAADDRRHWSLHPHQEWKNSSSPYTSYQDNYLEDARSPRGILKNYPDNRQSGDFYYEQKPWSYLPQGNQPHSLQQSRDTSVAPITFYDNRQGKSWSYY